MFNNNIFCEMKGKKVIHWGGGAWGEWGTRPNFVLEVSFQCLLGYPSILLRYPSNNHTFMPYIGTYVLLPSIHSIFYVTTALLKSDVFRQSKAYGSLSFGPTGMVLG